MSLGAAGGEVTTVGDGSAAVDDPVVCSVLALVLD